MDIVEINKLTQKKRVNPALDKLYELYKLTKEDSVILIAYACRKQYGVAKTVKILHGLDFKDFRF